MTRLSYISTIRLTLLILFILVIGSSYAQVSSETQNTIDSLKRELRSTKQDTTKLRLNVAIGELNRDKNIAFWKKMGKEAIRLKFPKIEANVYNTIGVILKEKGEILNALDYYHKSLKIEEEIGNDPGYAASLNNIAVLHDDLGDRDKAYKYYLKSVEIAKRLNLPGLGDRYWNLATFNANNSDSSTYYLSLSGEEYFKTGGDYGLGSHHFVMGTIRNKEGKHQSSIEQFQKAVYYYKRMNHLNYVGRSQAHIAENCIKLEDYALAGRYADSSLALSNKIHDAIGVKHASNILHQVYEEKGDFKQALKMYKLYTKMSDSIKNMGLLSSAIRQNLSYEYEKDQEIREAEDQKKKEINAEKEKRQNTILTASIIGLVLVALFAFFMLNRLRLTRRQKAIIENSSKEIMDSIKYAKRIQSAILPTDRAIKEHLPESFVLYKPKNVVAGDFYWMEIVGNKILFAAADCTGHGVPGAMVSVVCNNALNRSVREYGLSNPGEVLNKARSIVIEEFEKSDEEVKDGMDIAICSLEGNKLEYAGAHNPLWIIRNGELIETKADKQPIGLFYDPKPFTTHSFDLEPGDSIYAFTDGYADQFGGESLPNAKPGGKKFKFKAFKELLLSIQDKSMEDQKQIIDEAFENWKGSLEQIDDVCVIGVRF